MENFPTGGAYSNAAWLTCTAPKYRRKSGYYPAAFAGTPCSVSEGAVTIAFDHQISSKKVIYTLRRSFG